MKTQNSKEYKRQQQNPQLINRDQRNNSKAKMQYSFSQDYRFKNPKTSVSPPKYYDLPNLWTPKGTSLGYGKKIDLAKQNIITPSPGDYEIKSAFNKSKNEGITMSQGRDQIRKGSMFLQREEKTPTSTTYHPAINFNTKAYTIRKKIEPAENKWLKKVPGPGNYSYLELTNERNKKIISKYSSAASAKFGNSERGSLASKSIAPGPGQHDIISPNFDESVFDKPYSSKIGNSQRKALKEMNVPGPGSYEVFSEFSH